jgi:SAM-dependent methyltransferase
MKDFYEKFCAAVGHSQAHCEFCERVFGIDLGQPGFADLRQLELLQRAVGLGSADRVLDVGCGDGRIAEYLSDAAGAHVEGLDFIESAILAARRRTAAKSDRLSFAVADINRLDLPPITYGIILTIDSIYFSGDYAATVRTMKAALRPGAVWRSCIPTDANRGCRRRSSGPIRSRRSARRWRKLCGRTAFPFVRGI